MVNGKPNLTFGGVAPAATAARQRTGRGGARNAESFASYLPVGEAGRPGANQREVQAPAQSPAQAGGRVGSQAAAPGARMYLGHLPTNYISGPVNDFQSRNAAPPQQLAAPPSGNRSLAQARAQVLGPRELMNQYGNTAAGSRGGKTAPVISGQPVTRRGNIGMVDTRRAAQQPMPPGAAQMNARPMALPQKSPIAAPGSDPYTGFSAHYGGFGSTPGKQSFISHGFSSKNAEMALKKLGYDPREARSLQTYAQRLEPDPYSLKQGVAAGEGGGVRYGSTRPVAFASGEEGARTAVLTASHRKRDGKAAPAAAGSSLVPTFKSMADQGLGRLAAKFESGDEGIAAIGFDRKGGTSYGKYQIASRPGTMSSFIDYLGDKAPDLARRLAAAGPANTGSRSGRMPSEWRKIAAEDPGRFEKLQSDFIRTSHFEPAKEAIAAATGVTFDNMPPALQEVLFSTAVQHGPAGATRIVSQALQRTGTERLRGGGTKKAEQQLITQIYNLRAGQFVSSTSRVQSAVRNRLKQEMREALDMLT